MFHRRNIPEKRRRLGERFRLASAALPRRRHFGNRHSRRNRESHDRHCQSRAWAHVAELGAEKEAMVLGQVSGGSPPAPLLQVAGCGDEEPAYRPRDHACGQTSFNQFFRHLQRGPGKVAVLTALLRVTFSRCDAALRARLNRKPRSAVAGAFPRSPRRGLRDPAFPGIWDCLVGGDASAACPLR
jgi:hypothetical protein